MKKNKFQLKREATYANLIQAGIEVLCERGYSASSIDDVVSRAGYTKGAFYVHFESKEQFFLHLMDHRTESRESMMAAVSKARGEAMTLHEAVSSVVKASIAFVTQSPEWILVYMDFFIQSKRSGLIQAKYIELYANWIAEIKQLLEKLKENGQVSEEIDIESKSRMLNAFWDGCIMHHVFYKEELDEQKITDAFVKLLRE
ncbi:TetR family transcriptional regulator [Brevibacillus fluminis]|uniref:TetR family transcriptional regulator n=1 Tax=Brevibacillus fluminis TaxID=511487 RepID=UPI003F8A6F22